MATVFNVAGLYLLLPFFAPVTIPTICAVLASFVMIPDAEDKSRIAKRRIVSLLLATSALTWAVVGPYVCTTGPTYVFTSESRDPFRASIVPLKAGSDVFGHVLYFTDPIRGSSFVRIFVRWLGADVKFFDSGLYAQAHALRLPMSTAIRHTVLGMGPSTSAEELSLPFLGQTLDFSLSKEGSLRIALDARDFMLVHYAAKVNGPLPPWNEVAYSDSNERSVAAYAAELDSGLTAVSLGDFKMAMGTLESAFGLAPSDRERARCLTLLGVASQLIITGDIGLTQSLGFFSRAMQFWPLAKTGSQIVDSQIDNAVDLWIANVLATVFNSYRKEYPQWIVLFSAHPSAAIADRTRPKKMSLAESLAKAAAFLRPEPADGLLSAEKERLANNIGTHLGHTEDMHSQLNHYIAHKPDTARWVFHVIVDRQWDDLALHHSDWDDVLQYTAALCDEPWRTRYRIFVNDLQEDRFLQYFNDRDRLKILPHFATRFETVGYPLVSRFLSLLGENFPDVGSEYLVDTLKDIPAAPWWDQRYLDWFAAKSAIFVFALADAAKTCGRSDAQCQNLLQAASDVLQRDDGGKGRLFVPGLAVILQSASALHLSVSNNVRAAYRDATGMSLSDASEKPRPR